MQIFAGSIFVIVAIATMFFYIRAGLRHTDWQDHLPWLGSKLRDGSKIGGFIMRRWSDGKWEYRQPTSDEIKEREQIWSW